VDGRFHIVVVNQERRRACALAFGVNVTLTAQLAPTARLEPHVLDQLKSPLFVPEIVIFEKVSVAVPTFLSVAILVEFVPTVCPPKKSDSGEMLS
jgi:hypothetical protein